MSKVTPEKINLENPELFSDDELAAYQRADEKFDHSQTSARGAWTPPDLTDQEQAAWDKYNGELLPTWKSHWDHVDTVGPPWEQAGKDATYDPGKSYFADGKGEPTTSAPTVPAPVAGGENAPGGELIVNTDAIKDFQKNVTSLQDLLVSTQRLVEQMPAIKPGYFGLGGGLYRAIIGDKSAPGLKENTAGFLHGAVNSFEKLKKDLDTMVSEYNSAELSSTLTAAKLKDLFEDTSASISNGLGKPTT